jgi:hypothetical protein
MTSAEQLRTAILAACPIIGFYRSPHTGEVSVRYDNAATAGQMAAAAALINGWDWSEAARLVRIAKTAKAAAESSIDRGDLQSGAAYERLIRALALVTLDEINTLRVAASLSPRTVQQLINAIKSKVAATGE